MSSTLESSVLMGKNDSDNWHSIKNTKDLTMKQMFDISAKLVSEQSDEIYGVNTINWEVSSWKYLSWVGDEESHQSLAHRSYFQILYSVWVRFTRTLAQTLHGTKIRVVQKFAGIQKL